MWTSLVGKCGQVYFHNFKRAIGIMSEESFGRPKTNKRGIITSFRRDDSQFRIFKLGIGKWFMRLSSK